jgi:hypothetical protein
MQIGRNDVGRLRRRLRTGIGHRLIQGLPNRAKLHSAPALHQAEHGRLTGQREHDDGIASLPERDGQELVGDPERHVDHHGNDGGHVAGLVAERQTRPVRL